VGMGCNQSRATPGTVQRWRDVACGTRPSWEACRVTVTVMPQSTRCAPPTSRMPMNSMSAQGA
jgi:hypothetical protein